MFCENKDYVYENIVKEIINLNPVQMFELSECLNNYIKIKNKSKKDNMFIRYVALRGYKSLTDFYNRLNIKKDNSIAGCVKEKSDSLKSMLKLKRILNIDDDIFSKYMNSKMYGGEK